MLRAIVFDFDGVIANSEPLHFRGYHDVMAAEGVALTEKAYYSQYLGYDDVGAFERMGLDQGIEWTRSQIDELVARKAIRLEELERDISVLFPGAADAIRRAAAAMPIAIASGARGAEIRRLLERELESFGFDGTVLECPVVALGAGDGFQLEIGHGEIDRRLGRARPAQMPSLLNS